MRLGSRSFSSAILVAMLASAASAQTPVQFTYTQTDATTGSGTAMGMFDTTALGGPGILTFTGALPTATINQKGTSNQPLPAGIVGFVSSGSDTGPGAPVGVHLGFSGTVTLSAVDPMNASKIYQVNVPLKLNANQPMIYSFDVFENNSSVGGTNDVNGSVTLASWIGNDGSGHRHTGNAINFATGTAVAGLATAIFNLGGDAAGDDLGFTAGARPSAALTSDSVLFIDNITFGSNSPTSGVLLADDTSLQAFVVPEPASLAIWAFLGMAAMGFAVFRRRLR